MPHWYTWDAMPQMKNTKGIDSKYRSFGGHPNVAGLRNASLAEAAPTVGCKGGRLNELPDHSPHCTSSIRSAATPTWSTTASQIGFYVVHIALQRISGGYRSQGCKMAPARTADRSAWVLLPPINLPVTQRSFYFLSRSSALANVTIVSTQSQYDHEERYQALFTIQNGG